MTRVEHRHPSPHVAGDIKLEAKLIPDANVVTEIVHDFEQLSGNPDFGVVMVGTPGSADTTTING